MQDLAPIFILGYTCITTKRFPKCLEVLSIIMALLGVFFLTSHGNIKMMTVPSAALVTGVLSAICVMIYNVLAPKLTDDIPVMVAQG